MNLLLIPRIVAEGDRPEHDAQRATALGSLIGVAAVISSSRSEKARPPASSRRLISNIGRPPT
jgi:hypothetical protein